MNMFEAVHDIGVRYVGWLYFHDVVITFQILAVIIAMAIVLKALWKALDDKR